MVPVIHVLSLLVFSKLFAGFLEHFDSHADQFDAVYGVWSEHWQADPPLLQPLQQCWQHSYVHFPNTTSGYDAEHVPVVSGTCPVKPLYVLGHSAAAQFQGLGNLLIAYAIFMLSNISFFSDPQRVLCHEVPCWTSSDQYERAITPNLTHLLPIHTGDLVTLMSHMTPERENC